MFELSDDVKMSPCKIMQLQDLGKCTYEAYEVDWYTYRQKYTYNIFIPHVGTYRYLSSTVIVSLEWNAY